VQTFKLCAFYCLANILAWIVLNFGDFARTARLCKFGYRRKMDNFDINGGL